MGGMIHDFRVKDIFLRVSASPTKRAKQHISVSIDFNDFSLSLYAKMCYIPPMKAVNTNLG